MKSKAYLPIRGEYFELLNTITNFSYALNAKRIAKLSQIKPNQPDETLLNWVNFVLSSGPLPELKPELLNLSFLSYNNLDIMGIGFACFFITFQVIRQLIFFLNSMRQIDVMQKRKLC